MDFGAGNQNRTDDPIIAKQFCTVSEANVGRPYQWRALPTEPYQQIFTLSWRLVYYIKQISICQALFSNFLNYFFVFFVSSNLSAKKYGKTVDKSGNKCYNVLSYLNTITKRSRSQVSFREWMVGENPQGRRLKVACEWCGWRLFCWVICDGGDVIAFEWCLSDFSGGYGIRPYGRCKLGGTACWRPDVYTSGLFCLFYY